MRTAITLMSAVAVMAFSGNALAAGDQAADQSKQARNEAVDIVSWDHTQLYEGWRAQELMDSEVVGSNGEEIGEIENLLVSAEGRLEAIIVEAGGFVDIGDTHFRVAWDDVEVNPDMESVTVPMTPETAPTDFSLFENERINTESQEWRASELIDDYVELENGAPYGIVDDLIFGRDGNLQAVIVSPDVRYGARGMYAYPYGRYRDVGAGGPYTIPYTGDEIQNLEPFDYSRMREGSVTEGAG